MNPSIAIRDEIDEVTGKPTVWCRDVPAPTLFTDAHSTALLGPPSSNRPDRLRPRSYSVHVV